MSTSTRFALGKTAMTSHGIGRLSLFSIFLTSYWAVPITTSEQDLLSVNHETFMAWRWSDRFDGIASAESWSDRSHG